VKETVLEDEQQAQRVTSARTARTWTVKNPKVKNRLGQSVGYKIVIPENPLILAYPQGLIAKKGESTHTHTPCL
jgi:primary-amine oxidase